MAFDDDRFSIEKVSQSLARPLRHEVLRPHQSLKELAAEEDADAVCFAAIERSTGSIVSTVTLRRERCPFVIPLSPAPGPQWRLRGMATMPGLRSTGLGGAIIASLIENVRDNGGGLIWCAARQAALEFYKRAGFVTHGELWEEEHIGPHIYMWRAVSANAH